MYVNSEIYMDSVICILKAMDLYLEKTFKFMDWLSKFLDMPYDEMLKRIKQDPNMYTENIVRHIERLGLICRDKSIFILS